MCDCLELTYPYLHLQLSFAMQLILHTQYHNVLYVLSRYAIIPFRCFLFVDAYAVKYVTEYQTQTPMIPWQYEFVVVSFEYNVYNLFIYPVGGGEWYIYIEIVYISQPRYTAVVYTHVICMHVVFPRALPRLNTLVPTCLRFRVCSTRESYIVLYLRMTFMYTRVNVGLHNVHICYVAYGRERMIYKIRVSTHIAEH